MIEQLRAALQEVAQNTGRHGDTILAHITPEEAEYLEKKYGGGTENPVTGLKEYFGAGPGGGGPGDGGGGGNDPGTGRGGGGPAGGTDAAASGSSGSSGGGGSDPGTGRGGGGPAGGTAEAASGRGSGSRGGGGGPFGGRGPGPNDPGVSRGSVGPRGGQSSPFGGQSSSSVSTESGLSRRGFERALSMAMDIAFGNPFGLATSLSEEDEGVTGTIGAVRDVAETIGKGISAFGGPSANTVGAADPQAAGVTGISGPSGTPAGGGGLPPDEPSPPSFNLTRPDALEAPAFLGLGNAMTPLQQRAKIATFGTGAEAGGYRSDPAQDYYKNIFLRSVLGDEGEIQPNAQILPVEAQYAQQTLGLDAQPEMDIENFARSLSDLPSRERAQAIINAWMAANPQRQRREA